MANTMEWTITAQVRRVLAADARAIGIDAVYGLGYVLAGFLISPNHFMGRSVIVAPTYALSFVVFYLVMRVCSADSGDKTAMFYANLPRQRQISYWSHSLALGLFTLAMELLIIAGLLLQTTFGNPFYLGATDLAYFAMPWLVGAFAMWIVFGFGVWFGEPCISSFIQIAGTVVGSVTCIFLAHQVSILLQVLVMLLITCYMQWDGARRWQKLQIGELP